MFKLFFEYLDDFLIFYVNDISVYSKTENEHLAHLRKVFEKFHYAGMKLKPPKCKFFKLHIEYLGILISSTGIYPLEQKIQAILDFDPPITVTQVWHIFGLVSYYRKFTPPFQLNCLTNYCIDEKEHSICVDSSLSNSTRYYQTCNHQQPHTDISWPQ